MGGDGNFGPCWRDFSATSRGLLDKLKTHLSSTGSWLGSSLVLEGEFLLPMRLLNLLIWVFLIDLKAFSLEWNKKLLTCTLKLLLLMEFLKDFFLTLISWSSCPIFW